MVLGPIITEKQEMLFPEDKPIESCWAATSHVGRFFELLSKRKYRAKEIKHKGKCDCPDLVLLGAVTGEPYMAIEVKAFRKNKGHCLLKIDRMSRYENLKIPLIYSIWIYDLVPGDCDESFELNEKLQDCPKKEYAIDGEDLHKFCRKNLKLEHYIGGPGANPGRGFDFYRVKENHLKELCI